MKLKLVITISSLFFAMNSHALSPDAVEGKSLYPSCHVCHNTAMNPPLGPPMWGVQRQYKKNSDNDEDFVKKMVDFVKAPTAEKAIHAEAVKQMGLMPPLPLPDEILRKISTYILEENFPPPCEHWKIAIKRAEEKGDVNHAAKDKRMIKMFCE